MNPDLVDYRVEQIAQALRGAVSGVSTNNILPIPVFIDGTVVNLHVNAALVWGFSAW